MLRFDETDKYELKEMLNDALPKEIETYLNTEGGGHIFIGVKKNGEVIGIQEGKLDEIILKVADVITDQVLPKCTEYVHTHHEIVEGKDIIQIDIKKGNKLYYQKKYGMTPRGCHYRVGTKCQEMAPEEIDRRYVASLNIPDPDICEIEAYRQDLTFQILKNYLITHNYHFNDETIETNLRLRTSNGKYNYMAFMLADKNDIVINVATFATTDKTKYLKRDEFGGVCLLYAMEKAKDYVESSYNQTFVKLGEGARKEKKIFDNEAFEQAWFNACVHNKWSESDNPGIYIYSDRLEIESRGTISNKMTKEDFFKGVSHPINKKLFDIFKTCGFGEESGHGVPTVVNVYGEKAYRFSENYINVIIPFDKSGFENDDEKHPRNIQETSKKHPRNIQEEMYMLIEANPLLTIKDIMKVLRISEGITRHNIKKLRDEGIIAHKGSTKSGYWEIKQLYFRDRDIVNNKVQNEVQNEAQNVPHDVPHGVPHDVPHDVPQNDIQGDLSIIIELIRKNPKITREEMALAINKTIKAVQRIINKCEFIEYVGSGDKGHWKIKQLYFNDIAHDEAQNVPHDVPHDVPQNDIQGDLSIIIGLIRKNPKVTREEMALAINKNIKTVQRIINKCEFIEYVGSGDNGYWKIK